MRPRKGKMKTPPGGGEIEKENAWPLLEPSPKGKKGQGQSHSGKKTKTTTLGNNSKSSKINWRQELLNGSTNEGKKKKPKKKPADNHTLAQVK